MIDPTTLQIIRDIVTIFGVIAGFTYYVLTVRNTKKARQIEMLHRLHDSKYDVEGIENYFHITNLKWDNFDDYIEKYSAMKNPKHAAVMESQMSFYEGSGVIVEKQVIDLDTVYDLFSNRIISLWFMYETVIKRFRNTNEFGPGALYCDNFEHLANEMIKIRKQRGTPLPTKHIHPTSTLNEEYNR